MSKVIEDFYDIMQTYDPSKNTTRNILTRYEKVKVIGLRAEQIQRGAQPYVDFDKINFNPIKIATDELTAHKLPYIICRTLPSGDKEYWRLEDMIH